MAGIDTTTNKGTTTMSFTDTIRVKNRKVTIEVTDTMLLITRRKDVTAIALRDIADVHHKRGLPGMGTAEVSFKSPGRWTRTKIVGYRAAIAAVAAQLTGAVARSAMTPVSVHAPTVDTRPPPPVAFHDGDDTIRTF